MVVDGQGGKLGRMLIEQLKARLPELAITAIGTNSIATATMLKAGADAGATGENPVVVGAKRADVILGPVGIIIADALWGEITKKMANAIGTAPAKKILLPYNKCDVMIVGTQGMSPTEAVREAVEQTVRYIQENEERNQKV
ncbi:MAG: DUF3842 family protein [Clostridiaceae bacterium]|nr:DUF3842 family protein [Clostridiaceae bacterium]